jgi:exodeoxyribonuclease VIII
LIHWSEALSNFNPGVLVKPGIYPDLEIKKYHLSSGISKTGLCMLNRSAKTYRDFIDNPGKSKQTKSLHTGSIFHIAMEGAFDEECRVGPEVIDRRSREWKDFVKAHPGKICVTPEEARQVVAMREAMYGYGPAREALGKPGRFEVSYYWVDRETSRLCKCRPDWISADQLTIIDFKTAADATEEGFPRSAARLHYHVSAAMTVDGVHATTGIKPQRYIFLAIEPHAPYLTAAYEATEDDLAEGCEFIRRNLSLLKQCEATGNWPGLKEEIRPLDVRRFMRRPREEDESGADSEVTYSAPGTGEWWE